MAVSWTPAIRVVVKDGADRTAAPRHRHSRTGRRNELELPTGVEATYTRMQAYSFEVGRLYSPAGRPLAGDDLVGEDSVAVVHRVRLAYADTRVRFKPEVERDRSKLVRQGSTKVWDAGRHGVKKVVYRKRFVDGDLAAKRVVKSRVVKERQAPRRPRRHRPQLDRPGRLRVRRQPQRRQPRRLLRPLPVLHLHLACSRRQGHPDRLRLLGADQASLEALQGIRPLALAALRQQALATPTRGGDDEGTGHHRTGRARARARRRP